jgi:hypothetical protein
MKAFWIKAGTADPSNHKSFNETNAYGVVS